ncbi:hypothetical protein MF628_004935 [Paenibacillus polymyxa]|uniref:hypothetical protein n=1 Tax=Paenibacillus polymyxa TaxID=1406 RepID=UPI002023DBA5|nr:hypothetical protein [Paenibacillus polymyxa]URJ45153.1 hypothetical protein MF628_004935 [Paenibacillus polymyxa]
MNEQIKEIKERFEFNLRIAEATGGATGAEYKDIQYLLNLVDSLQQQLGEKDTAIAELHEYNRRYAADVDHLREQIAERDRKIEWLTNELGEEEQS